MSLGLVGQKCGMTRVFTKDGESIPVTVIAIKNNRITQIKTDETDGYCAIQITAGSRRNSRVTRPMAGHFAKAGVEAGSIVREFRITNSEIGQLEPGADLPLDIFKEGQFVDVRALSRGKGFAGSVKRNNFRMQDATHGNSLSHRALGSTGQRQTPGRVFKGKKMPGQLGNVYRTVQNQRIVKVDAEKQVILIRGAVPGAPDGYVVLTTSIKKPNKQIGE